MMLRPAFTEKLAEKLRQGASVNLVGDPAQGCRRLQQDLKHQLRHDCLWLELDLKAYQQNFAGLLQALNRQLPTPLATTPKHLHAVLSAAPASEQQPLVLCLRHFDDLLGHPAIDPAYNHQFLEDLNAIRKNPHQRLLCVSSIPHHTRGLHIKGGYFNAELQLNILYLPPLSQAEISAELKQRGFVHADSEQIAERISAEKHRTYHWLEFVLQQFNAQRDEHLPLAQRLAAWKQTFLSDNPPPAAATPADKTDKAEAISQPSPPPKPEQQRRRRRPLPPRLARRRRSWKDKLLAWFRRDKNL